MQAAADALQLLQKLKGAAFDQLKLPQRDLAVRDPVECHQSVRHFALNPVGQGDDMPYADRIVRSIH